MKRKYVLLLLVICGLFLSACVSREALLALPASTDEDDALSTAALIPPSRWEASSQPLEKSSPEREASPSEAASPPEASPPPQQEPLPDSKFVLEEQPGLEVLVPATPPEGDRSRELPAGEEAPIVEWQNDGFQVQTLSAAAISRVTGNSFQEDGPIALEELRLVSVRYWSFEGVSQTGELMVHQSLAQEVAEIFQELYEAGFPIQEMALAEDYGCDDNALMEAGNTSCFNMRPIAGTDRWSKHSYGGAVDINPIQNPYLTASSIFPAAGEDYLDREDVRLGMIVPGDACHTAFTSRGWTWGGDWPSPDYQHFEKSVE